MNENPENELTPEERVKFDNLTADQQRVWRLIQWDVYLSPEESALIDTMPSMPLTPEEVDMKRAMDAMMLYTGCIRARQEDREQTFGEEEKPESEKEI